MENENKQIDINNIKSFDLKTEIKVLNALNKVLTEEKENPLSLEKALTYGDLPVMDVSNCIMVIALKDESKKLLTRFMNNYNDIRKIPVLDYSHKQNFGDVSSAFNIKFLLECINILKACGSEKVNILFNRDYPITLFNDYFKIIIAPRIDSD